MQRIARIHNPNVKNNTKSLFHYLSISLCDGTIHWTSLVHLLYISLEIFIHLKK